MTRGEQKGQDAMTSSQAMLMPVARRVMMIAALAGVIAVGGCANTPKDIRPPSATVSPYDTSRGEVLWAVLPLRNESGTLQPDILSISDRLVAAVEEVRGVRCVPLNRTMEAVLALKLEGGVKSPHEARLLAQAMGVDGIVVGSLTAWDPYTPQVGITLALYSRPGSMGGEAPKGTDPRALTTSATGEMPVSERFAEKPLSTVSENLDAKNHQVLLDVQQYAEGRVDPGSALQWKRYVKSMDLYQEFVAHFVVDRLIQAEWSRMASRGVRENDRSARTGGNPLGGRTIERWAGQPGNETKSAER